MYTLLPELYAIFWNFCQNMKRFPFPLVTDSFSSHRKFVLYLTQAFPLWLDQQIRPALTRSTPDIFWEFPDFEKVRDRPGGVVEEVGHLLYKHEAPVPPPKYCLVPVVHICNPTTWEAEFRRIAVQCQPGEIVYKTPSLKQHQQKWIGRVTQVV
jgi:hypothetical protein